MNESNIQVKLVQWCKNKGYKVVSIPNEGKRSAYYGRKLKQQGLSKGFPDLFFPTPIGKYHGLFIELKTETGRATKEQKEWLEYLNAVKYLAVLCKGFDSAVGVIESYFNSE